MYEKVLRSVKDIKNSVTVIKKAHQEKTAFDGGKNVERLWWSLLSSELLVFYLNIDPCLLCLLSFSQELQRKFSSVF